MSACKDILCNCHSRAKMAELDGWELTIRNRQYGEHHEVVIDILELYNRIKALQGPSAESAVTRTP